MANEEKKFKPHHYQMLKCRGLDANKYEFVKETYGSLYIRNKETKVVKILYKNN